MSTLGVIAAQEQVIFTTRDFATRHRLSLSAASHQLTRMARDTLITQVTRGVWANPRHPGFTALGVVPYLLGREQGYVSFLTALHLHGVISQIPQIYHVATTGHGRKLETPIGTFEFHKIKPELMQDGIEWSTSTTCPYRIASPEKALLDAIYLSTRRGRRYASFPELDLSPEVFKRRQFERLVKTVVDPRIGSAIRTRSAQLLALHREENVYSSKVET